MENGVLFVHGSCVSRDSMPAMERRGFRLASYVARQSVISAAARGFGMGSDAWESALSSPFQQKSLLGDLQSCLLPEIDAVAGSISGVLMDLVDERGGVWVSETGAAITNSLELTTSKFLDTSDLRWTHLKFGTPAHLELWKSSFTRVLSHYRPLHLDKRIIVVRALWANESIEGDVFPYGESSLDPNVMNQRYLPYYEHLEEVLPGQLLEVPPELCVTTRAHRWGIAPFHYIDETYEYIAESCQKMGRWSSAVPRDK